MFVCETNPENNKFLRLIYLICNDENDNKLYDDGRFEAPDNESNTIESACKRIAMAAMMAQYFYYCTVNHKTFRLEFSADNTGPIVYRFLIKNYNHLQLWQLNQQDLYRLVANQLMNSELSSIDCKFLAFCSFSRYQPSFDQPIWLSSKQVKGYVSLGGNDLALLSTHCLYCWPENVDEIEKRFMDQTMIDVNRFMNDSNHRNTRSGCLSTTFGAMIHELGHIFGLAHRHSGIMSNEFNFIDEFFLNTNNPKRQQRCWWNNEELIILNLNHWFNHYKNNDDDDVKFILNGGEIKSKYPIRLIEYRKIDTNSVVEAIVFDCQLSIFNYKITNRNKLLKLFIIDQNGNDKLFYL